MRATVLALVFAPAHHELRIDRHKMLVAARADAAAARPSCERPPRNSRTRRRLTVFAPAAFADRAGHLRLIDLLPTLDAVGAAGIGQPLALLDALLVGIVRQQDVADRKVSSVKVVDMISASASRAA